MIRSSNGPQDRHVAVFVTPGNGLVFQSRTGPNAVPAMIGTVAGVKAPIWLRMEYTNGQSRAYYSSNGAGWAQIPNVANNSFANYQVGLAAASRSAYPNTSVYSNLSGF